MNISLNSIDDATLEYMVNVAQYEKYLRKNNLDYDTGFKKDLKFYRKRIISITKDLFKNEVKDVALNGAFNMYMKACISHLKFEDQSETIQKCYVCMGVVAGSGSSSAQQEQDKPCICNSNTNALHAFELNKANELCFEPKEVKKLTLDTYVIKKSSSQKKEPVVFPQQFKFNPKDPSFKYKGLKNKKKEKHIPENFNTETSLNQNKMGTTNEIS